MIDVVAVNELEDRTPVPFEVGGRELVLVRWGSEVFALRNLCPHQLQSFVGGVVHERVRGTGRPGETRLSDGRPVLACPWHSWEYELKTGACTVDPKRRVAVYPVRVESGRVLVDIKPASKRTEQDRAVDSPASPDPEDG